METKLSRLVNVCTYVAGLLLVGVIALQWVIGEVHWPAIKYSGEVILWVLPAFVMYHGNAEVVKNNEVHSVATRGIQLVCVLLIGLVVMVAANSGAHAADIAAMFLYGTLGAAYAVWRYIAAGR